MAQEPSHVQLLEFKKENIPYMNWMFEDLFCMYGTNIPFFLLDFEFPDYSDRPEWPTEFTGWNFNLELGPWDHWLVWFNELLGFLFDEAHLPRWQMPDFSDASWSMFNDYIASLYDNIQRHDWYNQSGTFTKDEVVAGETSSTTGYYKRKDSDNHIYIANKLDSSGNAIADYDEEKVVGQTSGAYAWTYLPAEPVYVYHDGATAPYGEKEGSHFDASSPTWQEVWDDYDNDPLWRGGPSSFARFVLWGAHTIDGHNREAGGYILVLQFDTTDTISGATTITLRLDIDQIVEDLGTPTVKLYKLTETFDPETHWDYTDNHIADQEISATGNYDIEISESDVNIGGTTQILVRLASTDVSQPIPPTPNDTEYNKVRFDSSLADNLWLKFEY